MKKKIAYLLTIMIVVAAVGAAFSYAFGSAGRTVVSGDGEEFQIVTSFYPIYVIAENLVEGIEDVQVRNLTENQSGCLHDYQLTTKDMKLLEQADVLLLNGAGMESFLEGALSELNHLAVISSEEGIELLELMSEHDHGGHEEANKLGEAVHEVEEDHNHEVADSHEGHDHGDHNAHVWLDPARYRQQVINLAEGLIKEDPVHEKQYAANRDVYLTKIDQVVTEYQDAFVELSEQPVIIFHDAFAYYEEVLPLHVVMAVEVEGDESALSAGEMAEVLEEIKLHGIQYLFIEEQYTQTVADVLAQESGTQTVVLDSLVTGDGDADSWLMGMDRNLEILKDIFLEN